MTGFAWIENLGCRGKFRGAARSLPLIAAPTLFLLLQGPMPARAGDRSVTILEGVEEPGPSAVPPPPQTDPLAAIRTENPAGLTLDILPNANLSLGSHIAFNVSTQRQGYLVLIDLNAEGKLTQIYPNVMSLSRSSGDVSAANLIKPGQTLTIPNPKNPLARFIFTADLPRGNGAIVAILSDRPVQIIDLPDIEASAGGPQAVVDALYQSVLSLKIASSDASGPFAQGAWSFAATPYVIQ